MRGGGDDWDYNYRIRVNWRKNETEIIFLVYKLHAQFSELHLICEIKMQCLLRLEALLRGEKSHYKRGRDKSGTTLLPYSG